jgi:hypothetical protein
MVHPRTSDANPTEREREQEIASLCAEFSQQSLPSMQWHFPQAGLCDLPSRSPFCTADSPKFTGFASPVLFFDAPDRFVGVIALNLPPHLPADVIATAAKILEPFLDPFPKSVPLTIDLPLTPIF